MTPEEREAIMAQWDSWRAYIARGGEGSWPRDAFEALLDGFAQSIEAAKSRVQHMDELVEAAKVFARLADEIDDAAKLYSGPESDPSNWAKSCDWEDLVRLRAILAKIDGGK